MREALWSAVACDRFVMRCLAKFLLGDVSRLNCCIQRITKRSQATALQSLPAKNFFSSALCALAPLREIKED